MALSHCRSCDEVFTSLGSFDAHQTEHYDRKEPPFVTCHDPRTTGKHRWSEDREAWAHANTANLTSRLEAARWKKYGESF